MENCSSIIALLKASAALAERTINDALSDLGVSHCQAQILLRLRTDAVSMSALSSVLCCHKSNVTQIVDGLARKSLLSRLPAAEDKRICRLALTKEGRAICDRLERAMCAHAEEVLSGFSAEERTEFLRLLQCFVNDQQSKRKATHMHHESHQMPTPTITTAMPSRQGGKRQRSKARSTT